MDENQKKQVVAEAENVEALRDFFTEWYTVEELYETMAKSCTAVLYMIGRGQLCQDDQNVLRELMMQHEMMIEHMKPFARKEDEA